MIPQPKAGMLKGEGDCVQLGFQELSLHGCVQSCKCWCRLRQLLHMRMAIVMSLTGRQ